MGMLTELVEFIKTLHPLVGVLLGSIHGITTIGAMIIFASKNNRISTSYWRLRLLMVGTGFALFSTVYYGINATMTPFFILAEVKKESDWWNGMDNESRRKRTRAPLRDSLLAGIGKGLVFGSPIIISAMAERWKQSHAPTTATTS